MYFIRLQDLIHEFIFSQKYCWNTGAVLSVFRAVNVLFCGSCAYVQTGMV